MVKELIMFLRQRACRKWRERMNKRNNKRPALQKEKISIIAASVFVLSALTDRKSVV